MVRKLALAFALTMSLLVAREASAITITEQNLDTWTLGVLFSPQVSSDFVEPVNDDVIGELRNRVYFDELTGYYTYWHKVIPATGQNNNERFATQFAPAGFTGTAGWSFSDALGVGLPNDATAFEITLTDENFIRWNTINGGAAWDQLERIKFFYVSTKAPGSPTSGLYNLTGTEVGTGASYAPTPEPGSMLLLGSGLAALYGARRRRNQKVQ